MDYNALLSFVKAAETLNFSIAAQQRNTVQSAVSAHIAKLEQHLGRTLFERGRGRAMELTPEGAAFLVYARRILSLSEEAEEAIRTANARQMIRIGTTVTLALSHVPGVLARFSQLRDDVQIHVNCDRSDALLDQLDNGEIDVAFMMDQGKRSNRAFVFPESLVWVCGEGFALRTDEPVPLAFLTDGRDLRKYAFDALDSAGRLGKLKHLSAHPIGVRAFVEAGLALTVMPQSTVVAPMRVAPNALGLPDLAPIAFSAYGPSGGNRAIDTFVALLKASLGEQPAV